MCWERERTEGRSQLGMEREGKFPSDEEIFKRPDLSPAGSSGAGISWAYFDKGEPGLSFLLATAAAPSRAG